VPSSSRSKAAAILLAKAYQDRAFLGWALAFYKAHHSMSESALADWLQCPPSTLNRLALCRLPDDLSSEFGDKVKQIARYGQCSADHLVVLLRDVLSFSELQSSSEGSDAGVLLAARDRKQKNHPKE
jgi:hypothetical protein